MAVTAASVRSRRTTSLLSAPRAVVAIGVPALYGGLMALVAGAPAVHVTIGHAVVMGLAATLAFGLLERYPKRLPAGLPRWILQLAGVVVAVPAGVLLPHLVHMAVDEHAAHEQAQ